MSDMYFSLPPLSREKENQTHPTTAPTRMAEYVSSPQEEKKKGRTLSVPSLKVPRHNWCLYRGPTEESNWVIPGRLMAGAFPASENDQETSYILSCLLELGVTTFVCTMIEYDNDAPEELWREGYKLRPYFHDAATILQNNQQHFSQRKIELLHLPIEDGSITDDNSVLSLSKELAKRLRETEECLYVHCWGGHGRTGTVIAVALGLLFGIDPQHTMAITQFYHDMRVDTQNVGSPQTAIQRMQVTRILNSTAVQRYRQRVLQLEARYSKRNLMSTFPGATPPRPASASPLHYLGAKALHNHNKPRFDTFTFVLPDSAPDSSLVEGNAIQSTHPAILPVRDSFVEEIDSNLDPLQIAVSDSFVSPSTGTPISYLLHSFFDSNAEVTRSKLSTPDPIQAIPVGTISKESPIPSLSLSSPLNASTPQKALSVQGNIDPRVGLSIQNETASTIERIESLNKEQDQLSIKSKPTMQDLMALSKINLTDNSTRVSTKPPVWSKPKNLSRHGLLGASSLRIDMSKSETSNYGSTARKSKLNQCVVPSIRKFVPQPPRIPQPPNTLVKSKTSRASPRKASPRTRLLQRATFLRGSHTTR